LAKQEEKPVPEPTLLDLFQGFFHRQDKLLEYMAETQRQMLMLLRTISGVPTLPPTPITSVEVAGITEEVLEKLLAEFEKYGVLKRANNWLVETIDLGTARDKEEITTLADALALTIYRCTGTFDLYLVGAGDSQKITVDALTYPQTITIDDFDIKQVWITNTAQSGLSAEIIKFYRT